MTPIPTDTLHARCAMLLIQHAALVITEEGSKRAMIVQPSTLEDILHFVERENATACHELQVRHDELMAFLLTLQDRLDTIVQDLEVLEREWETDTQRWRERAR